MLPSLPRLLGALAVALFFGAPVVRAADAPDHTKELTGTWQFRDTGYMGGFEAYTVNNADGTGFQIGHASKAQVWFVVDFTWKTEGNKVTVTLTRTSLAEPLLEKILVSEIVSLDGRTAVFSDRGEKHTETKVEALPDEFQKKLAEIRSAPPAAAPATTPAGTAVVSLATPSPGFTEKQLVGTWLYKSDAFLGGFEGYTVNHADGTAVQIGHILRDDKWFFIDFTWKLTDKTLTETITRSDTGDMQAGHVSKVELVSLDDKTMVSTVGGEKYTETRVDALPDTFEKKLAALRQAAAALAPTPTPAP